VITFPGASLIEDLKGIVATWDFKTGRIGVHLLIDGIVAILAIVGSLYFFRRYGFLTGALSLALLLPPLMSNLTIGMIRYILPVFFFPVFLAEIGRKRPWFHSFWVFASSLLLAFYTICFACWYWAD
jgi:hypothetical protein